MQEFLSLDLKMGKNFQFTLFSVSVLILFTRFLPSQSAAFFDTIDLLKINNIKIHI